MTAFRLSDDNAPRPVVTLVIDCSLDFAVMQRCLSPEQITAVLEGIGKVVAASQRASAAVGTAATPEAR